MRIAQIIQKTPQYEKVIGSERAIPRIKSSSISKHCLQIKTI